MEGACQKTTDIKKKKVQWEHESKLEIDKVLNGSSHRTVTEVEPCDKEPKKKKHKSKRRESSGEPNNELVHKRSNNKVSDSVLKLEHKIKKRKREKENENTKFSGNTHVTIADSKNQKHTRRNNVSDTNHETTSIGNYLDQMAVVIKAKKQKQRKPKGKIKYTENIHNETDNVPEKQTIKKYKHTHRNNVLVQKDKTKYSSPTDAATIKNHKYNSMEPKDETEFNENTPDHRNKETEEPKISIKNKIVEAKECTVNQTCKVQVLPKNYKHKKSELEGTVDTNEVPRKKKKEKVKKEKKKQDIAVKDEALLQKKALDYLKQWYTDRENWKFEKLRQIWLQQNMLNSSKVPMKMFPILVEYIVGAKGNTRKIIQDRCLKVIRDMEQWMELTEEGLGDAEILIKLPELKKVDEEEYSRARSLLQGLQDDDAH